ncbi:hypothetical protein GCM10023342_19930 [Modicisalibacter zincidurans]|uniref:Uncharacterized protein n=1 Tax=Modicisalibacter zincidurans TaxID=1178777 RepID=A0ABP9REQ3_9GAMM
MTVCQDSPTKLRARGRVLVLAHVRELVDQNHVKYRAYGLEADIFSAGLGRKQAARQVVFGSLQSVVRNLDAFAGGPADAGFTLLPPCHAGDRRRDHRPRRRAPAASTPRTSI